MKGHVQHEEIKAQIFDDQEIARIIGCSPEQVSELMKNWISAFVTHGGFKKLLHVLKDIQENLNNRKGTPEFMKIKAERECLKQLLNTMKTLLMAAFIANMPSPELSLALSQRMSSNNPNINHDSNEEKKDDKKAAII